MYLDRPANRLQSPSGFLSSEQVPPLSLLHVGASTPGFYGKYFIFFEIFNFMRLLKANFQNFIFFFFYGNTATRSAEIRAQKRTVQRIDHRWIDIQWKTIFIITQWQHITSQVFDARLCQSIHAILVPSKLTFRLSRLDNSILRSILCPLWRILSI